MFFLQPTQPYSLSLTLKRLQDMPRQVIARVEEGPAYVRALEQGGRLGLVRVREQHGGLIVTIEGDLDHEATLAQVRRAFALDMDLAAYQRHMAGADPVMHTLALKYNGARPIQAFDLWESLAWTIIGQQVNVAFAFAMKETLVRLGGKAYGCYPAFPGPDTVAELPYEALTSEKYSRKKAEYVIDTARLIASGRLNLEEVVALPFAEAVQALVKVRGIGRWTAECLLMDAGAPDSFPAGDIGIRNAVQRFYGLDHQPTEQEVRERGAAWAPYSALACYYLWLGLLDRG